MDKVELSMRILAVTNMFPTLQAPASGTFVKHQVEGLRQIGLDVEVMYIDRAQMGMRVYLGLRRQILAKVMQSQPNVIHVMYGGVMADQVTRTVSDRPIVVSFCGSDLLGEPLAGLVRKLIARFGVLASHRTARRASGLVVKSKNLRDALPAEVNRSKVRIIPNGVDLKRFKPLDRYACRRHLGWETDGFHVLFPTNSGDPIKRFYLAWGAVEVVRHQGIPLEIHQLQGVSHDDVPVWLNASDVVILTSLHEGSPNIIKEALACDVPVISVDVGDVRERLQGIEGCYLALAEPSDLAAKLRLVYAGERRVSGRSKVQALSLENVALLLKKFYEDVLASYKA